MAEEKKKEEEEVDTEDIGEKGGQTQAEDVDFEMEDEDLPSGTREEEIGSS